MSMGLPLSNRFA